MGIKVISTNPGVHGQFREVGASFEIAHAREFEPTWMECEHERDAEKVTEYRRKVAEDEAAIAAEAKRKGVPVVHVSDVKPARASSKASSQTTGNNPAGAQPPNPVHDTDLA